MNEEQRVRVEDLAAGIDGWSRADQEWLLALVKDLDEENARLRERCPSCDKAIEQCVAAEQQLAAVTAERDAKAASWAQTTNALAEEMCRTTDLEGERDELKREVERLKERIDLAYDTATLHMRHSKNQFAQAVAWRARAEKAEAERDALRAFVRKAAGETEHAGAPGEWGQEARELARLKDAKGGG